MLAMLGLTVAGAGVMKTQSAIAKQNELNAQKAQELANLQAQQDAQKAEASANWEENLAMQAEAGQDVVVGVKQSQANKNYWAAFAIWQAQVAEANARKVARAKEQFKLYIEANFKQLALLLGMSVLLGLLSLVSPSQNPSLDPIGKHPKWDEYVQSYTSLLPNMPEKSCLNALPGGGVIVSEECSGGGGGIAFILLWLYWQLTKANVDVRTEPRDNNTILVSHYTSEANATEILATGMISPYEDYVYVFEGRSSSVRAREAGATLYEVRLVFDASPSELEMDPEQTRREIEKRNDILNIYNIMVIHEARRFRFPVSIDISWRRACIERPIHLGIFSLGQWTRCR